MHGWLVVIVYTSMCISIVFLTSEKPPAVTLLKYCRYNQSTFRIAIEITRGLRQRFTWPKLYYLLAAQLTLVMKFKPSIVLCLRIWAIQLKFLTQIKWKYLNYEFLFKRMKLMSQIIRSNLWKVYFIFLSLKVFSYFRVCHIKETIIFLFYIYVNSKSWVVYFINLSHIFFIWSCLLNRGTYL